MYCNLHDDSRQTPCQKSGTTLAPCNSYAKELMVIVVIRCDTKSEAGSGPGPRRRTHGATATSRSSQLPQPLWPGPCYSNNRANAQGAYPPPLALGGVSESEASRSHKFFVFLEVVPLFLNYINGLCLEALPPTSR